MHAHKESTVPMPSDPPGFAAQLAEDYLPKTSSSPTLVQGDIARLVAGAWRRAAGAADAEACRAAAHGIAGRPARWAPADLEQVSRRAMTNRDPAASLTALRRRSTRLPTRCCATSRPSDRRDAAGSVMNDQALPAAGRRANPRRRGPAGAG